MISLRKYTIVTHEYLGWGSAYFIGLKRVRTKDIVAYVKKNPDTHLVFTGWPKEIHKFSRTLKKAGEQKNG